MKRKGKMEQWIKKILFASLFFWFAPISLVASEERAEVECFLISIKVDSKATSPDTQTGTVQFRLEQNGRLKKTWRGNVDGVITSRAQDHVVLKHSISEVVQTYPRLRSNAVQDPSGYQTIGDVSTVLFADPAGCRLHVVENSTRITGAFGPLLENIIAPTYTASLFGTVPLPTIPGCGSETQVDLSGSAYSCFPTKH